MFAIFKTGGKQYKAAKDALVKIEKIEGEPGSIVVFDQVVLASDGQGKVSVGAPLVKDMKISAEIVRQIKDDKVLIFKKKRRHNYRRFKGHRQQVTWIKIQEIGTGLQAKAAPKKAEAKSAAKAAPEAKTEKLEAKKPAAKKSAAKKDTQKK